MTPEVKARNDAYSSMGKDYLQILARRKSVLSEIRPYNDQIIFFYTTDDQFSRCHADGTSDRIIDEFLEILMAHDKTNLITLDSLTGFIRFESKETFDRDYDGQEWKYFK